MAYDGTNRKRDSGTWEDNWTKETDAEQVRDNQDAVRTDFDIDHDTTTGKHGVKNLGDWISNVSLTSGGTHNITSSVDDNTTVNLQANRNRRVNYPEISAPDFEQGATNPAVSYPWGYDDFMSCFGTVKGIDASGGEAELVPCVTNFHDGGAGQKLFDFRAKLIRRTQAAPVAASDFEILSTHNSRGAFLRIGPDGKVSTGNGGRYGANGSVFPKDANHAINDFIPRNDVLTAARSPIPRNMYDRFFQNTAAFKGAYDSGHLSDLSEFITWEECYNGQFHLLATLLGHNKTTTEFATSTIRAHGGNPMAILPLACGIQDAEASWLPGWDDTNCYFISWDAPGDTATTDLRLSIAATTFELDVPPNASFSGSFDGSFTVTRGDAIDVDSSDPWQKIAVNDLILQALWETEHRDSYSGAHSVGVDRFTGYTLVKDAVTMTASGTVGVVSTHTIEAWNVTDGIYLVGIVGASGAGIVAASLGGDETDAKLYLRPVTVGSTNDYAVTIVRLDLV